MRALRIRGAKKKNKKNAKFGCARGRGRPHAPPTRPAGRPRPRAHPNLAFFFAKAANPAKTPGFSKYACFLQYCFCYDTMNADSSVYEPEGLSLLGGGLGRFTRRTISAKSGVAQHHSESAVVPVARTTNNLQSAKHLQHTAIICENRDNLR